MSHVADVSLQIRDLDALRAALKQLPVKGELIMGQKTHQWYGRFLNDWNSPQAAVNRRDPKTFGKCDHAVKFEGINYELGLVAEPDGSYTMVYDSYGSGGAHDGNKLQKLLGGPDATVLKNEYACAVSTRLLARRGFRVSRSVDQKTGEIKLVARN